MIEVEQNDLVQHKSSKNVYRVVNPDTTTGKVTLEVYPTLYTIEVTPEELSLDYIKIEGCLIKPYTKLLFKPNNKYFRLNVALPNKLKSHDLVTLRSCESNTCYRFFVEELFHDFVQVVNSDTSPVNSEPKEMNFIEAITFLVNNPSKSVVRTSYSAGAKDRVQFYIKDIDGEPVIVTQCKDEAPQRRHIVSDIDEKFEVYIGPYSRYDESAIKEEFEKLEKEVQPFLEKVERYKQLKKALKHD